MLHLFWDLSQLDNFSLHFWLLTLFYLIIYNYNCIYFTLFNFKKSAISIYIIIYIYNIYEAF